MSTWFDQLVPPFYDWATYREGKKGSVVMDNQLEEKLHHKLNDLLLLHIAIDKFVMARHGLRRVRFYILRHLYENPDISITRLSELSFADTASISRMIYGMEKKGLVQRKTSEEDRRFFVLSLTEAGKAKYEAANTELKADIYRRFANLAPEKLEDLLQKAQVLTEMLSQHHMEQSSLSKRE